MGEGVADFKEGDVAFIGSNVPHLHLCGSKLMQPALGKEKECVCCSGEAIQFRPELFPPGMENIPDYQHICDLLKKSQYGVRFYDDGLYEDLLGIIRDFDASEYTSRIICLFRMLERMHRCKQIKLLSDTAYNSANIIPGVKEPINKIYDYLYNHFQEKIVLQDVAECVGQHPSALCRYFKQRTDKSIFQCLAEIRIEHACKLLAYSNMTVSQVAYESGYNNITHFISQFEKYTHRTPSEYRMQVNS